MSYVGFDEQVHLGEMVVHQDHADAVTARLRAAVRRPVADPADAAGRRLPGRRRPVHGGEQHLRVQLPPRRRKRAWSAHAYGAAIDINPVQNPYVTGTSVGPPAGRQFAAIDRSAGAHVPAGAIHAGDVVVRAFARIGWEWGGDWSTSKDYQHFSASGG